MSDLNNENAQDIENIDINEPVEDPIIRLKTKPIPIIIVLSAAAVSCVISVVQFVDFSTFFTRLALSVFIFAIIGSIVKIVLDFIFNKKAIPSESEGEEALENPIEADTEDVELPEEEAEALETQDE